MRIFIMALAAIAIIGGGGAGVYFYFVHPAEASTPDDEKAEKKQAKKEKSGEPHKFVQMQPLILPIIDGNNISQVISLIVSIEVATEVEEKMVKAMIPRLQDAYIQDMYGMLNKKDALKDGLVQVSVIKSRLNDVSTEVLGEDIAKDVLLQVVQQNEL